MKIFNSYNSLFKALSVTMLLGVYIAASLFNNLHNYFHHEHHSKEICSVETEKNPCHQKVIHHNQTNGCKHQTHVYALKNQCELCHALLAKYYFPDDTQIEHQENENFQYSSFFDEAFVFKIINASTSLRGPPTPLFYTV